MIKIIFRWAIAGMMIAVGIKHFTSPDDFVKIVPIALPEPLMLVYLSGFFEILGGLGLLIRKVRRYAALGLVLLYLAVFPANINMAVNHISIGDMNLSPMLLWARLPLQFVMIALVMWVGSESSLNGDSEDRSV